MSDQNNSGPMIQNGMGDSSPNGQKVNDNNNTTTFTSNGHIKHAQQPQNPTSQNNLDYTADDTNTKNAFLLPPQQPKDNQRRNPVEDQFQPSGDHLVHSIQTAHDPRSKSPSTHHQHVPVEQVQPQDIEVQIEPDLNRGQSIQTQGTAQLGGGCNEEVQLDINADWWKEWEQEKKLKVADNFNVFKIPKVKQGIEESTIIGVIDQSGSMGDCFSFLATQWNEQIRDKYPKSKVCIFHNLAYEADELQLEPEMGTTDVEAGFTLLNNVLIQDDIEDYVTVIFISDGQDNNQETIFERLDKLFDQIPRHKKINFLTIGVGEQFPTFLAMQLRQMYHTGETNIPPVFLVYNQHVHENWKVTFNLVNKYLNHNDQVQAGQEAQKFPWFQPSKTVFENSYVFSKNTDSSTLSLDGGAVEIQSIQKLTPKEVLEVGSFLLSSVQLRNLKFSNPQQTSKEAAVGLKILIAMKDKWWGKAKKKKEEKEQIDLLIKEFKSLEKDPNLKGLKDTADKERDHHLALKLAAGAIGAGIGLYWLSANYGDFAEFMGGMNFAGDSCFGECGMCDQVAQCMGCDSCGQCCADIFSTGQECLGTGCKYFCQVMEYVGNFICSILGE